MLMTRMPTPMPISPIVMAERDTAPETDSAVLDAEALALLHAWLSPGYPTGAFAYSHGLEQAIADGQIRDAASLEAWLSDILLHGAGRSEALLVAEAWSAPEDPGPAERALALAASAERRHETLAQGAAFLSVTEAVWTGSLTGADEASVAYPVALGRAARRVGVPLAPLLPLVLQAFVSNLVSAAVRFVPLGQTEGQQVLRALLPLCRQVADEARAAAARCSETPLDAHGTACFRSDIAAMRHETLETRVFRT